ncbi:thiamine diphosphokinase [Rhodobacteraceae bacterium]|nr:thiamine diphosphokinase [Paracoccaceae bacterium]
MIATNVQSQTGVSLVGGGNPDLSDIGKSVAFAPCLVAADGGANFCIEAGFQPVVVIGDLDSISEETRTSLPDGAVIEYTDQDLTDFEKCLKLIAAPFVIATGFAAGRLDHTLANFAVLSRRIGPPTLILGSDDVAFASPLELTLDLPIGTRFSLFPMGPMKGQSSGLRWPIDGLTIDPSGRLGTSNEVSGPVALSFDAPGTIVIIPRVYLQAAIAAISG